MLRRRSARRAATDRGEEADASMPTIDGYGELAVIGHGASATVYRAVQDGYDRAVALKVLNVDISDRRAQKRFHRERAVNGRLSDHPNVVTVLDSGFVVGRYPYLAMELFEQGSLTDRLAGDGPFEVAKVLHVGIRIAGALDSAHRLGILHRDVKPQNILLSRFGEPALADFGIAAILEMEHSLTAALTPVHAPPEVLEGDDPTPSADVYALASTLHTMLSGAPPFIGPPGEGMLSQLLRITTSEPPSIARSDIPDELTAALKRAMAKQPADRFASAADFGVELQRIQRDAGLETTVLPVEVDSAPTAPTVEGSTSADELPPPPPGVVPARSASSSDDGEFTIDAPPPTDVTPREEPIEQVADGIPIEAPTVVGRQTPAPLREPPEQRPAWVVPLAVVAALIVGGLATWLAIAAFGGSDDPDEAIEASPPPVATTVSAEGAALAPIGLEASTDDDVVLLVWRDRTNGDAPQIVYTYRPGLEPVSQAVEAGATSVVIAALDPDAPACFTVSAVLALGDEATPATTADSEPACINNASAQVVTG